MVCNLSPASSCHALFRDNRRSTSQGQPEAVALVRGLRRLVRAPEPVSVPEAVQVGVVLGRRTPVPLDQGFRIHHRYALQSIHLGVFRLSEGLGFC